MGRKTSQNRREVASKRENVLSRDRPRCCGTEPLTEQTPQGVTLSLRGKYGTEKKKYIEAHSKGEKKLPPSPGSETVKTQKGGGVPLVEKRVREKGRVFKKPLLRRGDIGAHCLKEV